MEKYAKARVKAKPNGNLVVTAKCPFCGYECRVVVDPEIPVFPAPPDVCEHWIELVYGFTGSSGVTHMRFVKRINT